MPEESARSIATASSLRPGRASRADPRTYKPVSVTRASNIFIITDAHVQSVVWQNGARERQSSACTLRAIGGNYVLQHLPQDVATFTGVRVRSV